MRHLPPALAILVSLLLSGIALAAEAPQDAAAPQPQAAIAMHGEPKYKPGFNHLDYVNVDAPKGGEMHFAAEGTFDSLNPFILKSVAAPSIGMLFQTLTTGTGDEAFSRYGL